MTCPIDTQEAALAAWVVLEFAVDPAAFHLLVAFRFPVAFRNLEACIPEVFRIPEECRHSCRHPVACIAEAFLDNQADNSAVGCLACRSTVECRRR